jgi:hypothetical protein
MVTDSDAPINALNLEDRVMRRYFLAELEEISVRNEIARHMVAGFSVEMPVLADLWRYLDTALADTPVLLAEITWLTSQ